MKRTKSSVQALENWVKGRMRSHFSSLSLATYSFFESDNYALPAEENSSAFVLLLKTLHKS